MTQPVLTEDESSRIGWAAWSLDIDRAELLKSAMQIKSRLTGDGSLYARIRTTLQSGLDSDGVALKAIFTMVKGALGGAMVGFSGSLAPGLASLLVSAGITVSATVLASVIFVVGAILLIGALRDLPALLSSLAEIDWSGEFAR